MATRNPSNFDQCSLKYGNASRAETPSSNVYLTLLTFCLPFANVDSLLKFALLTTEILIANRNFVCPLLTIFHKVLLQSTLLQSNYIT